MKMIVHDGTRYRPEDAKRRGVKADEPTRKRAAPKAKHKARQPAGNATIDE